MTFIEVAIVAAFVVAFTALVALLSVGTLRRRFNATARDLEGRVAELEYKTGLKDRPEFGAF